MTIARDSHLLEHELIALIDDDVDPAMRADYSSHLKVCRVCESEEHRLRRVFSAVSSELSTIVPPAEFALPHVPALPVAQRSNRRLAAAAAIVGITILSFATVEPLQALALRVWERLISGDSSPRIETVEGPPIHAPQVRPIMLQFVAKREVVQIDIGVLQTAGKLTIRRSQGPLGSIQFPASVEAMVSESAIDMKNTPAQAGSYVLEVPASVHTVRVRLAGREQTVAVPVSGSISVDLSTHADPL